MNKSRLARAMGICEADLHFFWMRWPLSRCSICGRLKRPICKGDDQIFYHALIQERPRLCCREHFYREGQMTAIDCLTGTEVELPRPRGFLEAALGNILIEIGYWASVLCRYIAFTVRTWACYITHPAKTVKVIRIYKEHGWRWEW